MQHELNHTVQTLLGARGLDELSRENLSALLREHPYSALLHLLYSKKLQQAKDPQYAESVARTALYFSNPHWLHHILRPKTSKDAVQEMEQAFADHTREAPEQPQTEVPLPVVPEFHAETPVETTEEVAGRMPELSPVVETPVPAIPEIVEHTPELLVVEETPITTTEETAEQTPELSDAEQTPLPAAEEQAEQTPELSYGEGILAETTDETTEQASNISTLEALPQSTLDPSHTLWQEPGIRTLETIPELPGFGLPSPETGEPEQTQEEPAPVQEITAGKALPSTGPLLPVDVGLLPLEPYYTIDYFASQGIQLTDDEKQDPLGRKLKKFTAWLKTMKKIHPDKSGASAGEGQSEETVREVAEHSNDRAEIVTEAMAEVYAKQGQPEKALEIYQKLSLLDPSRSATFAAKIAELNNPDR